MTSYIKPDKLTKGSPSYSERATRFRYLSGIAICFGLAIPLAVISFLAVPYSIYEAYLYYYSAEYHKNIFLLHLITPVVAGTLVWGGITLFQWGKHLTNPNSNEFA